MVRPTPPPFDALPLQRPGPPYNAWGLWGADDELGRLNLITPDVVKAARDEIKEGIVINLNMPLDNIPLNPVRQRLEHTIIPKGYANDDHLSFNTQCSTQWDGFRHYPYQDYPEKGQTVHYGGMTSAEGSSKDVKRLGVDNYTRKPISSRAHLLDIDRHIRINALPPLELFDNTTPIPVSLLQACADAQGVEFRTGDILLVNTGWTKAWYALDEAGREAMPLRSHRACTGVAQGEEMLRWHWERGIAAVASDVSAYEAWPPKKPALHEVFLSGWGLPIGETFDLRELAAECERLKRWTFFFASVALYVPGGIASPANAQALL
ncbi:uncharacterized protein LOC62_06G008586 [Vanrija pseudolonga]|uniref:Cyclase n=1 Tax=Vanrija pseudolonga TaxID=143232 RepID=A0AAF0YEW0_9TREE|nr:hypothetical protein LOC62_06G008586 [Vanrija pseudolonga]